MATDLIFKISGSPCHLYFRIVGFVWCHSWNMCECVMFRPIKMYLSEKLVPGLYSTDLFVKQWQYFTLVFVLVLPAIWPDLYTHKCNYVSIEDLENLVMTPYQDFQGNILIIVIILKIYVVTYAAVRI